MAGASVQSMPVMLPQETGKGFKVATVGAPVQFSDFAVLVLLGAKAKTPVAKTKTPTKVSTPTLPVLKVKKDLIADIVVVLISQAIKTNK